MSKIALTPNASGTGTLTVAAPNTNTDRTLTLPDATGTVNISGLANEVPAGSAGSPSIYSTGDSNTGVFFPAADTVAVATAGVERMRIDASGNVGIGTSSPDYQFQVEKTSTSTFVSVVSGTINTTGILFGDTDSAVIGRVEYDNLTNAMAFYANASERMRIDSSGSLILVGSTAQKATGTTWSNPSDQRLKSNIMDYPKGITELMQVRVREWEYNGKGGTTAGMAGLGVIADEVMTVLPNTVDTYDAKLNEADEETTAIKKFDATEITWLLVKAVQEQQQMIQALQADIAALKGV